MKILVSACLLGLRCRYDGQSKPNAAVLALGEKHTLVPCCPEQLGGLPTPRSPSEWQGKRIVNQAGQDVTAQYLRGGEEAVRLARTLGCELAILKERSPACGSREIYDGSFSGVLLPGEGSAARALREAGIPVLGESELDRLPGEN
jgi:uncharacterized protein YbbK (DUF523 family)